MPKGCSRAKTKAGKRRAVHKAAKKLKAKPAWSHLTWKEAHGVASSIVSGKRKKKKRKR